MHTARHMLMTAVTAGALALGALVAVPGAASAATITVGGGCDLPDAITAAQTDTATGSCVAGSGDDTIALGAGTIVGTVSVPSPTTPGDRLVIAGAGLDQTVLDGGAGGTTLTIESGAVVTLRDLTISGGQGGVGALGSPLGAPGGPGGAGGVANGGDLSLMDVKVAGNQGGPGGAGAEGSRTGRLPGGSGGRGGTGGISNDGDLSVADVVVEGNAGGSGGRGGNGTSADCSFSGCDFPGQPGGPGGPGGAGGVTNAGVLALVSTSVGSNSAGDGGAGGTGGRADFSTGGSSGDGPFCSPAQAGGSGGVGGPGGLYVGDLTQVTGSAVVAANTGGAGGAGGAGGVGEGTIPVCAATGPTGSTGAAGETEIRRGAQELSWTTAPPTSASVGDTFPVVAVSTSGRTPTYGASGGCSYSPSLETVSVTGPGTTCTVTADRGGDDYFTAAPQLSEEVSVVDSTPPLITPTVTGTLGADGWYVSDVTVSWSVIDAESAVTDTSGCEDQSVTADTAGTELTCEASSEGGTDSASVTIKRDTTAPSLAPSVSPSPAILNGSATAFANATDGAIGSGVDGATVTCSSPGSGSVGAASVTCSAADVAGNSSGDVSGSYTVAAPFGSFKSPLPKSTYAKAKSSIPVKFTLRDARGPLSATASRALAMAQQVRVVLTRSSNATGAVLASAACTWDARNSNFACTVKTPRINPITNSYYVTVQEASAGGTDWFNAPNVAGATGASANPVEVRFK